MWPWRPLNKSLPQHQWWDNWSYNFAVSVIIFPALAGLITLIVALIKTGVI